MAEILEAVGRSLMSSRIFSEEIVERTTHYSLVEKCGPYWDRTSDLFRVKEARYRCANGPRLIKVTPKNLGKAKSVRHRPFSLAS